MSMHKLTSDWRKIASEGENADVLNAGQVSVETANFTNASRGRPLLPGGQLYLSGLRSDLFARSEHPGAEVSVRTSPGRLPEL